MSIEDAIQKAMDEGKFDDLPGKGKPLQWDENPNENPEWALAHHILKSSGYTLPWIETLRQLDADLQAARASLQRAWAWKQSASQPAALVASEWGRAVEQFRHTAAALNQRIFTFNLEAPAAAVQRSLMDAEAEIAALEQQG